MEWSLIELDSLYDIGSSKRVLKSQWTKDGIPFYRGREITKLSKYGAVDNELYISELLYEELAEKYGVPATDDIVITAIGTLGNSYIVGDLDKFYFKDASVLWLKKKSNVSSEFINFWLKSPLFFSQLNEGNGATVDTLTIKKLKSVLVPLPSEDVQEKVVKKLKLALADIEQARTNTEKNLQNARELFDSYLLQVFSERGDGWEELALQNAVSDDCSLSYGVVQPGEEFDGGIPVIRPVDLKKKSVEKSGLKRMDPKLADSYQRTSLSGSELLLCVRGETGTVAVSDPSLFGANVTRGIVPIKFSEEKVSLDFAYFQFLSPLINRQIKEKTYGTALKQINIRDLRQLSFFIPPIDKQYVIAEKLSEYQRAINKLESVYKSKLDALDELKQSLLQQAFTGQLTQG